MHKTISITIGSQLFHVEDAAYQKLEAYLSAIRAHFASYPESEEIVSDIEDRIAEGLASKLNTRKKAVSEKDVDGIIAAMGTIKDFEEFDNEHSEGKKSESKNDSFDRKKWGRLYRDGEDTVIGGVCSGIAKFFNIDPVIPRLLFGLSILMGGSGVIIYILLWIILPEAKTASEKVEMTQGKVTLSAIRERVEKAIPDTAKHRSSIRKAVLLPFAIAGSVLRGLGSILRVLMPVLGRIVGGIVCIAGALGIAAMTTFLVLMITNPQTVIVDFPVWEVVGRLNWLILVSAGYFIVLMPLVLVILIGASLLALRSAFSTAGAIVLTVLWFVALNVGLAVGTSVAPEVQEAAERYEQEHAQTTQQTISTTGFAFTGIKAGGSVRVEVRKGDAYAIQLDGPEESIGDLSIRDEENTLVLEQKHRNHRCFFFCQNRTVTAIITMPALSDIKVGGASRATAEGFTYGSGSSLALEASGASRIDVNASPASMHVNVFGASRVTLTGSGKLLESELDGASRLEAGGFAVEEAVIAAHGASRATVNAAKTLSGEATDASRILYIRKPDGLDVTVSGAGRVLQTERDDDGSELYRD